MAKVMVAGINVFRSMTEKFGTMGGKFVPRLLPGVNTEQSQPSTTPVYLMVFIAVVIPVLVVTIASVVYLRFGQSVQYDELYLQALNQRAVATGTTDPASQRDAWQSVLVTLDKSDAYRQTPESEALRKEAQANFDQLMGVVRLEFIPAFANGVSGTKSISRLAASESELYMLDEERGNIQHAAFTGRALTYDSTFDCKPGTYGGYQVGTLVDILALPKVNALGATVLGIDANGNLLYCTPGQVPQAIPLPPLPNTSWGRVTAFALDGENLYVLDAPRVRSGYLKGRTAALRIHRISISVTRSRPVSRAPSTWQSAETTCTCSTRTGTSRPVPSAGSPRLPHAARTLRHWSITIPRTAASIFLHRHTSLKLRSPTRQIQSFSCWMPTTRVSTGCRHTRLSIRTRSPGMRVTPTPSSLDLRERWQSVPTMCSTWPSPTRSTSPLISSLNRWAARCRSRHWA